MSTHTLLLAVSLLAAAEVAAQGGSGDPATTGVHTTGVQDLARRVEAAGELDAKAKQDILEEEARLAAAATMQPVPEEKIDMTPRAGLQRFVSAMVAVRPERIAPGGTGTVHVMLALLQSSVLEAGAHISLTYEAEQGPVSLGQWSISEPKPGRVETRFQGQPVYDNTAVISVPVHIAAGAAHELYPLAFQLEADVTEAASGRVQGRFNMEVPGRLEVGTRIATPRPNVTPGSGDAGTRGAESAPAPRDTVRAAESGGAHASEPTDDPLVTARQETGSSPVGTASDSVTDGMPRAEDRGVPTWMIGAAAAMLLLGVLLALKRR